LASGEVPGAADLLELWVVIGRRLTPGTKSMAGECMVVARARNSNKCIAYSHICCIMSMSTSFYAVQYTNTCVNYR